MFGIGMRQVLLEPLGITPLKPYKLFLLHTSCIPNVARVQNYVFCVLIHVLGCTTISNFDFPTHNF